MSNIHEYLVDRVDVHVLGRDVVKIDLVYLRGVLHVEAGVAALLLQGTKTAIELLQDVIQALDILQRALELLVRLFLTGAELDDTGGLLEDLAALTALGGDHWAPQVQKACSELGIDLSHARTITGGTTSTYLYLMDEQGEMALAVSDMEICKKITPAYLSGHLGLLQNAQVVICDCNIPEESLVYLAENCTAPLFCDPVSTIKAEKLRPILGSIHTLKPNRLEAELLTGIPIHDEADVEKAADKLLAMGLRRVFISLGGDGMYAATHDASYWGENLPCRMVNTTGCGDSAMAALVWAYLEGLSLEESVRAALAAGSITIESPETISPEMSEELLRQRMT